MKAEWWERESKSKRLKQNPKTKQGHGNVNLRFDVVRSQWAANLALSCLAAKANKQAGMRRPRTPVGRTHSLRKSCAFFCWWGLRKTSTVEPCRGESYQHHVAQQFPSCPVFSCPSQDRSEHVGVTGAALCTCAWGSELGSWSPSPALLCPVAATGAPWCEDFPDVSFVQVYFVFRPRMVSKCKFLKVILWGTCGDRNYKV